MVPVHPDDHSLLGVRWGEEVFIDTALPFGLRSAPKIFSAVADALAWILQKKGVAHQLHYLDDFLLVGPPDTSVCAQALQCTLDTCQELGVPVAAHKTEGPSCQLTFLGIQIDTIKMELSLSPDKLARITMTVSEWRGKKAATKKQLKSLIATLSHAAMVVIPGRAFLRRMIDTMKIPRCQHHQWLEWEFNPSIAHTFWLVASGSWGHTLDWFQLKWPDPWKQHHIAAKEIVLIVTTVALWGRAWSSSTVLAFSDKMPIIGAISAGVARDPLLMHLLRCLHFFCAHYGIVLRARHIAGIHNTAADALSRDKHEVFLSCIPQAPLKPSHIPQSLLDMLLLSMPDWTSSSWRTLFVATLQELLPQQH